MALLAVAIVGAPSWTALARDYDLETDIGIVAESPFAAKQNTQKLTAALQAQWTGGEFKLVGNRKLGPLMGDIVAGPREFFFVPGAEGMHRAGGKLRGTFGRLWPLPSGQYEMPNPQQPASTQGGLGTRFTVLVDEPTRELSFLRLYAPFQTSGIEWRARYFYFDPTGEGPDGPHSLPSVPGIRCKAAIEFIGGLPGPAASFLSVSDSTFCDFRSAILATGSSNADNITVDRTTFFSCDSDFRSENLQTCCVSLRDIAVGYWGGAGLKPVCVADVVRGGDVWIDGLSLNHPLATIFRSQEFNTNAPNFSCSKLRWDHVPMNRPGYLTIFEYAGRTDDPHSGWMKYRVRASGSMTQGELPETFDQSRFVRISKAAGHAQFPLDDILIDIAQMPKGDAQIPNGAFEQVGGGPWCRPTDKIFY